MQRGFGKVNKNVGAKNVHSRFSESIFGMHTVGGSPEVKKNNWENGQKLQKSLSVPFQQLDHESVELMAFAP